MERKEHQLQIHSQITNKRLCASKGSLCEAEHRRRGALACNKGRHAWDGIPFSCSPELESGKCL